MTKTADHVEDDFEEIHGRRGVVKAGDPSGAYAATDCCGAPACLTRAMAWVEAVTDQPASWVPDPIRGVTPHIGSDAYLVERTKEIIDEEKATARRARHWSWVIAIPALIAGLIIGAVNGYSNGRSDGWKTGYRQGVADAFVMEDR